MKPFWILALLYSLTLQAQVTIGGSGGTGGIDGQEDPPEFVITNKDGKKSLNFSKLIQATDIDLTFEISQITKLKDAKAQCHQQVLKRFLKMALEQKGLDIQESELKYHQIEIPKTCPITSFPKPGEKQLWICQLKSSDFNSCFDKIKVEILINNDERTPGDKKHFDPYHELKNEEVQSG